MENIGTSLLERIKELSDIEVQEKELKFAIFNNKIYTSYEEKIKLISDNFDEQLQYYRKKDNYGDEKEKIISRYNEEFQKIYDKRKEQFINIINEIQEMQSNQKIALANIESVYRSRDSIFESEEYKEYLNNKNKFEYMINITKNSSDIEKYKNKLINLKNPVDSYNNKLIALVDKFEKYDGLVFECEKKLDDCIIATEEDFETLMKYRNNNLVEQKKENIFVRLFKKLFASKRKFKKEVIEKMNSEIDDIQNSNIKLLDIIENQTINLVAKIEELRYDINYEYSIATE